jgi:hypothetical protein
MVGWVNELSTSPVAAAVQCAQHAQSSRACNGPYSQQVAVQSKLCDTSHMSVTCHVLVTVSRSCCFAAYILQGLNVQVWCKYKDFVLMCLPAFPGNSEAWLLPANHFVLHSAVPHASNIEPWGALQQPAAAATQTATVAVLRVLHCRA